MEYDSIEFFGAKAPTYPIESVSPTTSTKVSALITMRGVVIKKADFDSLKVDSNYFCVTHTTFIGKKKCVKKMTLMKLIQTNTQEYYTIPRFRKLSGITYKNNIPEGRSFRKEKFKPGVDLFENQQVAFDYLCKNVYSKVSEGFASCIFVMDPGLGKTYIGGAFIEFCKKKTLIILQNTSPLDEWTKMLGKCFPKLRIGMYYSKCKLNGDVVIMTVNSALSDKFTFKIDGKLVEIKWMDYFSKFGAVIFDEVHNYATPKRQEIFWRTNFQYGMGLTATPDERLDGMDSVNEAHVGNIIRASEIPGFKVDEIKWKGKVRAFQYFGPPEFTKDIKNRNNWTDTSKTCDQLINDPYRNKLLIREIKRLYDKNMYVFVFSERRSYLLALQDKFNELGLINEMPEAQTLMGGSTQDEKSNARDNAKIILITYGYGVESISIPKMDAIVFSTPRRNKMRQTLGRILRRGGDPSIVRIIVDIIDENISLCSQFNTRRAIYHEKDFPIKKKKVSFDDL